MGGDREADRDAGERLHQSATDLIRLGMTGNLADYELLGSTGGLTGIGFRAGNAIFGAIVPRLPDLKSALDLGAGTVAEIADGEDVAAFGRGVGIDVVADPFGVRRNIGVAGQYASVDEDLTARQNLVLFGRLLGKSRPASRDRAASPDRS